MHLVQSLAAIPVELWIFAAMLLGIALFHHFTLHIALAGTLIIALHKMLGTGFAGKTGFAGLTAHLVHEAPLLINLFLLLTGFALLARHFEESQVPAWLPKILPDDWTGGVALLGAIFVLSAFLDNIAAAIIGATVARTVYSGRVHIGYLAAIVAASNAGGSGSVVGDTTTTMMWIAGVSPFAVLKAYVAAAVAFVIFAIPSSLQQQRLQPIRKDPDASTHIVASRLGVVAAMLVCAVSANVIGNTFAPDSHERLAGAGAGCVGGAAGWKRAACPRLERTARDRQGHRVPARARHGGNHDAGQRASCRPRPPQRAMLGVLSAVFDNIPLTGLAIKQGGYDWGLLAFAVGFGGSMMWFGSSAGVAVCNQHPEARSAIAWLRGGWPVAAGFVAGTSVYWLLLGWNP